MNMQQTEATFLKCGKLLVTKLHLVLVLHLVGCYDKEQQIPWIRIKKLFYLLLIIRSKPSLK